MKKSLKTHICFDNLFLEVNMGMEYFGDKLNALRVGKK
ncbi:hypothetical protein LMG8526_2424 [Lactococcus lactis subsp. lactis]|nr:hypothetical protein LMG8526_2424 [Lactococcus lactis subsp. lactis]